MDVRAPHRHPPDEWTVKHQLSVVLSAPRRTVDLDFAQCDWWGLTFGLGSYSGVTCTTCSAHAQWEASEGHRLWAFTLPLMEKVNRQYVPGRTTSYLLILLLLAPQWKGNVILSLVLMIVVLTGSKWRCKGRTTDIKGERSNSTEDSQNERKHLMP